MKALTNIFISYRRSDTGSLAGRIADRLCACPGIGRVFLDVDIPPGIDFLASIQANLALNPICIVLIGKDWRGPPEHARIYQKHDTVRMEIAQMLARRLYILPVLEGGAQMPTTGELPEDLHNFTRLNALTMRHESFERDFAALAKAIGIRFVPMRIHVLWSVVSFLASALGIVLAAALHKALTGRSLDQVLGGRGQVWMLILCILLVGTSAGTYLGRRRRTG